MVFGDKIEIAYDSRFSSKKLLHYVETLIRELLALERRHKDSKYTWLKSSHLDFVSVAQIMEEIKPKIFKLTPESCAAVACKLDNMANESVTMATTVCYVKNLLDEQHQIQMIQENVGRNADNLRRRRMNRVHPELSPPGRRAVVSFILLDNHKIAV